MERCLIPQLLLLLQLTFLASFGRAQPTSRRDNAVGDSGDDYGTVTFVSRPDIVALRWERAVYDEEALAPGYWFVSPYKSVEVHERLPWMGPQIYDSTGGLIWSGGSMIQNRNAFDLQVQQVAGKPMLTFMARNTTLEAKPRAHTPYSDDHAGHILDDSYDLYETIAMADAEGNYNMHDLTILNDGERALMLTHQTQGGDPVILHSYEGPCDIMWQGFREVDLATGRNVFEWNAKGHIDLAESNQKDDTWEAMCENGFDILHLNSVDRFDDGDYLLSARHTDTIYKISHVDGSIVWRLGGRQSDFQSLDMGANFTRQHHAKFRGTSGPWTWISLFNNAAGSDESPGSWPSSPSSSSLVLALRTDVQPMTVQLAGRYEHPDGSTTAARGSVSLLENGNVFTCWVISMTLSEHSFDGRLLMKARARMAGANTYRAFKSPWVGRPSRPPDVHSVATTTVLERLTTLEHGFLKLTERDHMTITDPNHLTTLVHVSWNGATEVSTWRLLRTDAAGNLLDPIASVARQGFETAISFQGFAEHVVVVAMDLDGVEIGRSNVVQTTLPAEVESLPATERAQWIQQHSSTSSPNWPSLVIVVVVSGLLFACCVLVVWRTDARKRILWWRSSEATYVPVAETDEERILEKADGG